MSIPTITEYRLPQADQLPTNKVNWQIDLKRAVLLVHDMQDYFINFYERSQSPIAPVIKHIQSLKAGLKAAGVPIVYTAQPTHQDPKDRGLLTDFWGTGLTQDEAIISELTPDQNDVVNTKWRYSAFKRSDLQEWMQAQGKDQLIICGVYAHIGVMTSALEAFMLDIKPFVIADACADFSLSEHNDALAFIAGRCGYVTSMEEVNESIDRQKDSGKAAITQDIMRNDIAEILMLSLDEIEDDENLTYLGLDSIRAMMLFEKWQKAGANIQFEQMASTMTLAHWWQQVAESIEAN